MTTSSSLRPTNLERDVVSTPHHFSLPESTTRQHELSGLSNNYYRRYPHDVHPYVEKINDLMEQEVPEFGRLKSRFLHFLKPGSDATINVGDVWASNISIPDTAMTAEAVAERSSRVSRVVNVAIQELSLREDAQLREAFRDLDEVKDEALEEGFPIPPDVSFENVRRLLRDMYTIVPQRYKVYPTPDGEIAIDVPGGYGYSVLLLCDSNGGALCSVNMNGVHRRARYSDTDRLPDGFVSEALNELQSKNSLAT